MNWKRALFFIILLTLIGLRHFSFSNNEPRYDDLRPIISALYEIDGRLENTMGQLVNLQMAAPPDQDYLIIMAKDSVALIKLICFYNTGLLSAIMGGKIKEQHLSEYAGSVAVTLEFEKVRIQGNLERIDSVYPVIRDKAVLSTLDEAKDTVQSILPLFDKGIAVLEKPSS